MSSAKVSSDGKVTQLDGKATANEVFTTEDAQEPEKVARLIGRLLVSVATLRRQWRPRRIDFEDVPLATGGVLVRLQHNFNGRVRWWVVDYQPTSGSAAPYGLMRDASTDANTLSLTSSTAGTATIRVEEAG